MAFISVKNKMFNHTDLFIVYEIIHTNFLDYYNRIGLFFVGLIPVPVRPPNFHNVITTLPTVKMIVEVSKSVAILTTVSLIKLLRSKEAQTVVEARQWPIMIPTEDLPKKRMTPSYRPPGADKTAYLDFSVSTTGMLAGVKVGPRTSYQH